MDFRVGVCLLLGIVAAIYLVGRWILGPIDRAAKGQQAPPRISIGDFLCLFVAVQLPLTLASRIRSEETEVYFWIFAGLSWIVAPFIWISCARTLSRAGIMNGLDRFVFLGLVLPIVYYGLLPFMLGFAYGLIQIVLGHVDELLSHSWWILGWLCVGVGLILSGVYTHWLCSSLTMASGSETEPPDLHADASLTAAQN